MYDLSPARPGAVRETCRWFNAGSAEKFRGQGTFIAFGSRQVQNGMRKDDGGSAAGLVAGA